MFENGGEIRIRNKAYLLLFNVAALKEIGERYGGIEELGEKLQEDYQKAISEYAWIIALLVRQGIALKNFEEGTNEAALTPDQLELLMSPKEMFGLQEKIFEIINAGISMGTAGEEDDEEVDEVLEEVLASKNGEGAGE